MRKVGDIILMHRKLEEKWEIVKLFSNFFLSLQEARWTIVDGGADFCAEIIFGCKTGFLEEDFHFFNIALGGGGEMDVDILQLWFGLTNELVEKDN